MSVAPSADLLIRFDLAREFSPNAHTVRLCWLACPADFACDALANLALDLVEERNVYRELLLGAFAHLHRLREQHARLRDVVRELQKRSAA